MQMAVIDLLNFSRSYGLSQDILFFLGPSFVLLLNLLGLFVDGLGDLFHDDLLHLLLKVFGLAGLNSLRHFLLDRLENLGDNFLRYLFVDLLCDLGGFRHVDLLGDLGAYLCHRAHSRFEDSLRVDCRETLHQEGYDAGPAGLMAGADASTGLSMEVFMEENVVAPMLIAPPAVGPVSRPPSFMVGKEQAGESASDFLADLQEIQLPA